MTTTIWEMRCELCFDTSVAFVVTLWRCFWTIGLSLGGSTPARRVGGPAADRSVDAGNGNNEKPSRKKKRQEKEEEEEEVK